MGAGGFAGVRAGWSGEPAAPDGFVAAVGLRGVVWGGAARAGLRGVVGLSAEERAPGITENDVLLHSLLDLDVASRCRNDKGS